MIDILSLITVLILIALSFSLGKIISFALKSLYYLLIAALILVFVFDISFNELLKITREILLWVF